jgi:hypothetical protein
LQELAIKNIIYKQVPDSLMGYGPIIYIAVFVFLVNACNPVQNDTVTDEGQALGSQSACEGCDIPLQQCDTLRLSDEERKNIEMFAGKDAIVENLIARDECYLSVARIIRNPVICRRMEHEYMERACIALLDKNVGACKDAGNGKDYCYFLYAIEYNDSAACEMAGTMAVDCSKRICFAKAIQTDDETSCSCGYQDEFCKETVYYRLAIKTKDTSLCEKTGKQNDSCIRDIRGQYYDMESKEDCDGKYDIQAARWMCYTYLAQRSHNETFCSSIPESYANHRDCIVAATTNPEDEFQFYTGAEDCELVYEDQPSKREQCLAFFSAR